MSKQGQCNQYILQLGDATVPLDVVNRLHTGSLDALAIGQFVPAALLTAAGVLLRQGITLEPGHLEQGRDIAPKTRQKLDGLRAGLEERLEQELSKTARRWSATDLPPGPVRAAGPGRPEAGRSAERGRGAGRAA